MGVPERKRHRFGINPFGKLRIALSEIERATELETHRDDLRLNRKAWWKGETLGISLGAIHERTSPFRQARGDPERSRRIRLLADAFDDKFWPTEAGCEDGA